MKLYSLIEPPKDTCHQHKLQTAIFITKKKNKNKNKKNKKKKKQKQKTNILYLCKKSAIGNLDGNPCRRILMVSKTPVYLSCLCTIGPSKWPCLLMLLGLTQRTNCGSAPSIFSIKSVKDACKNIGNLWHIFDIHCNTCKCNVM